MLGVYKINFQLKSGLDETTGVTAYYCPMIYKKEDSGEVTPYLGSYTSIIGSSKVESVEKTDMYRYLNAKDDNAINNNIKKIYYTALGRERYNSFNINNINAGGSNDLDYYLNEY